MKFSLNVYVIVLVLMVSLGAAVLPANEVSIFSLHNRIGNVKAAPLKNFITNIPVILNDFRVATVFGVEMYKMNAGGGLDKMNQAGISWIRHNDSRYGPDTDALVWTAIEPKKGDRN